MTFRSVLSLLLAVMAATGWAAVGRADDAPPSEAAPTDLWPAEGEGSSGDKTGQTLAAPANSAPPTTPPPAAKPAPSQASAAEPRGRIEGTILPADRVKGIRVVNRAAGTALGAAYDRATGKFSVQAVPPGVWALEIETTWGRVEGVDCRFRPAELQKQPDKSPSTNGAGKKGPPGEGAAKKSGQAGEGQAADKTHESADSAKAPADKAPAPLNDEDRAEIARLISGSEQFMTPRVLAFVGDGRQVTALVSLLRDRGFHGRKGDEVVWRLETWYYAKPWGTWERVGGAVVFRERTSGATFRSWTRQFEPALGGLEIRLDSARPVVADYTVGELPDGSRGLVAAGAKAAPQTAGQGSSK